MKKRKIDCKKIGIKILMMFLPIILFFGVCYVVGSQGSVVIAENEKTEEEMSSIDLFDGAGWKLLDVKLYGSQTVTDNIDFSEEDVYKKASAFEEMMFQPVCSGAFMLWYWFNTWNIDITIDGLVYGRMSSTYDGVADFTHFGMEKNNPYGIVGSTMYFNLRSILLSVLPIVLICIFLWQLLKNGSKERAMLKEAIQNSMVILVLLFAWPFLLNFIIYLRDGIIWVVSTLNNAACDALGLIEFNFGKSVTMFLLAMAQENPTAINNMLFAASVGASLFFFGYYIYTAGLLTACFGFFPVIAIIGIFNKRILVTWWNVFFPNLLIPLIDLLLIQIPAIIYAIYCVVFSSDGSVVLCILILIFMFNMTKFRAEILKILGYSAIPGGSNMLGMMFLAMRMFSPGAKLGGGGDKTIPPAPDSEKAANVMMERGSLMREADSNIKGLPEFTAENYGGAYNPYFSETDNLLEEMNTKYATPDEDIESFASIEGDSAVSDTDIVKGMDADAGEVEAGVLSSDGMSQMENVVPEMQEIPDSESAVPVMDSIEPMAGMDESVASFESDAASNFRIREPKPLMDEAFYNDPHVSARDMKRYENLAKMDACNERIKEGENFIKNSGYNPATYRDNMSRYQENIKSLDVQINNAQKLKSSITDTSSQQYRSVERDLSQLQVARQENVTKMEQLKRGAEISRENGMLRQRASEYADIERQYARNSALGGMSDRSYSSADDFKRQMQVDMIKKKQADYKNFDSRQYEGILSPQERENFYRTRALREKEAHVHEMYKKVASATVGVAVAAPTMVLSAYGGPTAMAGAAFLGMQAGSMTGSAMDKRYQGVDRRAEAEKQRHLMREERRREQSFNEVRNREIQSGTDNGSVRIDSARQMLQEGSDRSESLLRM